MKGNRALVPLTALLASLAVVALALFPSRPAAAGAQGRILGHVTDGSGKPLEGVKVTITTSAITNFKLVLTTDKDGKWGTILNDATLKYLYTFEKQGFQSVQQEKKVPIGSTETLDVQLLNQQQMIEKGLVKEVVDPYSAAYNDAVDKFKANDLGAALAKAEEAIQAAPTKAGGYELATKIAFQQKAWDKVIAHGEKSLSIDAENSSLFALLAEAHKQKGNKEKAKEYQEKLAAASPDDPTVVASQYNQAVDLFNKGNFKGAEPLLKKLLEGKPDYAEAHYLIGMCYVNLNNAAGVKKHFNEYLKLDPNGKEASTVKELLSIY